VSWAKGRGSLPVAPTVLKRPVHRLAQKLYAEFRRADAFLPLIVESIGLEMVTEICRRQSLRPPGRPPLCLKQAKEELHERFSERISLADIAHSVGFHPVHFARMFRRYFGCSMGEYVRLRRIECASFALKSTRAPLAEIAVQCGFFDQSHFTKTFQDIVGVTPSQYRLATRGR
jgi:AraC family transcriptional regulator